MDWAVRGCAAVYLHLRQRRTGGGGHGCARAACAWRCSPAARAGKLRPLCDVSVVVGVSETFMVQELHLPVYHALCLMLEYAFFPPAQ